MKAFLFPIPLTPECLKSFFLRWFLCQVNGDYIYLSCFESWLTHAWEVKWKKTRKIIKYKGLTILNSENKQTNQPFYLTEFYDSVLKSTLIVSKYNEDITLRWCIDCKEVKIMHFNEQRRFSSLGPALQFISQIRCLLLLFSLLSNQ